MENKNIDERLAVKILDERISDLKTLKDIWCLNKSCRRCMIYNHFWLRYCPGISGAEEWSKDKCFEKRRYAKEEYKKDAIDFISFLKSLE